jgi:DNA-binding protein HU-beta
MNKRELIEKIAKEVGITKVQADAALDSFTDTVTATLKKGERVTLVGFGKFPVLQFSSHPSHFQLSGRSLKVYYDGIKLGSKKEYPDACTGFVTFKLKPLNNVSSGVQIPNDASIKFDYELPIKTGTVLNTIYPYSDVSKKNTLFTFPNPTSSVCTVQAKSYKSGIVLESLRIMSLTGDLLMMEKINTTDATVDLSQYLSNGSCVLIAKDIQGNENTNLVTLKKITSFFLI